MKSSRVAVGMAAAVGLVVAASAGGAVAATLITSKQIKDGTIVGVDVKNGGLTGADLADGSIRSADIGNGTVARGDLSSTVSRSLIGGQIPSGVTVTGDELFSFASTVENDFAFTVNLPGRAAAELTPSTVNFAADDDARTIDDDATCTGEYSNPTAPPGKVCLYLANTTSDAFGIEGDGGGQSSFWVRWNDTATVSADTFMYATWAYTAP